MRLTLWPWNRSGSYLEHSAAAQEWIDSGVMSCSSLYKLAGKRLKNHRSFCGPMQTLPKIRRTLNQSDWFERKTFKDLEEFLLSMFPREYVLKEESARRFWNPIFIADVESMNIPSRIWGTARYTSTNQIMTSYMEKRESWASCSGWRVALDVLLRIIGAIMALEIAGNKKIYLNVTAGWCLLTDHDCLF